MDSHSSKCAFSQTVLLHGYLSVTIQCKEDISAKFFEHFEHTKPCTVANNLLRLFCFMCSFLTKIISKKVYTLDLAAMA